MVFVKFSRFSKDTRRQNNGGDYTEWIRYDFESGLVEWHSTYDGHMCPSCGRYVNPVEHTGDILGRTVCGECARYGWVLADRPTTAQMYRAKKRGPNAKRRLGVWYLANAW